MRAMGFYPSEQEIEDMLNEVKFSRYVETGQYVDSIDLGEFIKLYTNHRPAFGLDPEKLIEAFDILGVASHKGSAIERGDLLDYLQTKGEHMTEYELAEYLTTLLGFNAEGGSSELQEFDSSQAGDIIDQNLPHQITADMFSKEVLGFSMYNETPQSEM
ncbi:cilia- and flagella-associated protein 251-like [Argopecten irradians]